MAAVKSYVDIFLSPSTQHYLTNNTMVGQWLQAASAVFWHQDFWLPDGVTWSDMEGNEHLTLPSFYDVWVYPPLLGAVVLLLQTFFFMPYVLEPLARAAGLSSKRPRLPPESRTLEALYQHQGVKASEEEVKKAASDTNMTGRQVERWLRRRHAASHTTLYEKFTDNGFSLIYHLILVTYGWSTLLGKPWVWDITQCWDGHPFHPLDNNVWWFYILGLSFFWVSTFLQIHSPGRSKFDKMQTMVHHLFTILLMVFSWICNHLRFGTLVLLVHEVSDIPLLTAKMFVHAGIKGPQDVLFGVFISSWIITRCYLFPFWILRSMLIDYQELMDIPSGTVFVALLFGLLLLNIIWTVLIGNVVLRKVTAGALEDVRSDVEDVSTTNEEEDSPLVDKDKAKAE